VDELLGKTETECDSFDYAGLQFGLILVGMTAAKEKLPGLVEAKTLTDKAAKLLAGRMDELIKLLGELEAELKELATDKTTSFDELVKKLVPINKKIKKVKKLLKQLVKELDKAGAL
jgi:hypothetical protein